MWPERLSHGEKRIRGRPKPKSGNRRSTPPRNTGVHARAGAVPTRTSAVVRHACHTMPRVSQDRPRRHGTCAVSNRSGLAADDRDRRKPQCGSQLSRQFCFPECLRQAPRPCRWQSCHRGRISTAFRWFARLKAASISEPASTPRRTATPTAAAPQADLSDGCPAMAAAPSMVVVEAMTAARHTEVATIAAARLMEVVAIVAARPMAAVEAMTEARPLGAADIAVGRMGDRPRQWGTIPLHAPNASAAGFEQPGVFGC